MMRSQLWQNLFLYHFLKVAGEIQITLSPLLLRSSAPRHHLSLLLLKINGIINGFTLKFSCSVMRLYLLKTYLEIVLAIAI